MTMLFERRHRASALCHVQRYIHGRGAPRIAAKCGLPVETIYRVLDIDIIVSEADIETVIRALGGDE